MMAAALADPARVFGGCTGGVPPNMWTACGNKACRCFGVRRQVWLPQVAVGVVAFPTLLCQACGFVFPLNLPLIEEGIVPKLHADRPPTNRHEVKPPVADAPKPAVPQVVGEHGPELVVAGPDGVEVVKPKSPRKQARRGKGNGSGG